MTTTNTTGILYLIPTPIAENTLHTIPEYGREIVRNLDFFICEKGKTTRVFLKSLGMAKPLQEMTFLEMPGDPTLELKNDFLAAVKSGKNVGLLSEAGCPGVADPGATLVAAAHRAGILVKPLVGPSSLLLALMASGMNGQSFTFHGYLPAKRPELAPALRKLEQNALKNAQTQFFIETPYRSAQVLEVALESLQPHTPFGVAQDLTGAQEFVRTLTVGEWRKMSGFKLVNLPTVFLVGK